MSIGILFLSLTPGYHSDVLSYLFGNILLIDSNDLKYMMGVDIVLLISIVFFYNYFLAMSYDREFLYLRGINSNLIYTIFLILTTLSIVMSVRAIGIILVLALFTIPPIIAERFTKKFYKMIIISSILAEIFTTGGIFISAKYDIAPTPAIVIIATTWLFLSLLKKN
jgi:zinc transport system permease protein